MKFIDFEKLAALFLKYWDKFLIDGVEYTLALAAITVAFGAVFASVLALMKMSKIPPLRCCPPSISRSSAARPCCCSCTSSTSACPS